MWCSSLHPVCIDTLRLPLDFLQKNLQNDLQQFVRYEQASLFCFQADRTALTKQMIVPEDDMLLSLMG